MKVLLFLSFPFFKLYLTSLLLLLTVKFFPFLLLFLPSCSSFHNPSPPPPFFIFFRIYSYFLPISTLNIRQACTPNFWSFGNKVRLIVHSFVPLSSRAPLPQLSRLQHHALKQNCECQSRVCLQSRLFCGPDMRTDYSFPQFSIDISWC